MTDTAPRPIIVRRKTVVAASGHHGGAWKVAYADFVTAMMAFFLLMWLLGATTEDQRKGIADYFDPTVPISPVSGGGTDMLSGDTVFATEDLSHDNHGGQSDSDLAGAAMEALSEQIADGSAKVTLSPEGVIVDLIDGEGAPLFAIGGTAPSPLLADLLGAVVPVLRDSDRDIKIVGHTDDLVFRSASYTNWDLSADRAKVARRIALDAGLPFGAVSEISGRADRQPIAGDAGAPGNRRISVIMLTDNISSRR